MNLVDAWTTTVGNPFDKGRKARMLKQRLVKDKKPIVALFPTSYRVTGSLHFSPVTKYDYRGWWIFKTLWVRTMDDITGKGEYNLSASWNIATGVFYIEKR